MYPSLKSAPDVICHSSTDVHCYARARQRGFSLIELMVGMVVSLICTLAIMAAFAVYEGHKRTTTSSNDAQQNGSFSLYELERQVRSAGSGIINGSNYSLWGCPIQASTGGNAVLPATAANMPTPFSTSTWPLTMRVVPVLIASGGANPDVIGVLGGNAAYQAFNIAVSSTPDASDLTVGNNLGILANDYLIGPLTNGNCALAQIATVTGTTNITLTPANTTTGGLQTAVYVFDLGQQPIFTLFGVDTTSNTLVSYDLLQRPVNGNAATATPIADGIVQIKALYGIHDGSTAGQSVNYIDHWVQPTGAWDITALTASTAAASTAVNEIKAIRIAVVAQSRLPERASDYNDGTPLTLFTDLPPAQQYSVARLPQYRYKVYDTTIPLHNAMIPVHF